VEGGGGQLEASAEQGELVRVDMLTPAATRARGQVSTKIEGRRPILRFILRSCAPSLCLQALADLGVLIWFG
jgi:hypothetical protein